MNLFNNLKHYKFVGKNQSGQAIVELLLVLILVGFLAVTFNRAVLQTVQSSFEGINERLTTDLETGRKFQAGWEFETVAGPQIP